MPDHHMAHTTVLMWGSLFCLLAAWCMGKDKNYNREKKRWMLHMQLFTALFLSSEAFAWAFDGRPGKTAWWMVRISNFLLFLTSDLVLVFFNWYVGCHLMPPEERKQNKRYRLVSYIGFFAAFLVVVSQFTHLYYTFDGTNLYHRTSTYLLAMVLPASGMLLDFTLLVQYRKRIRRRDFLFMSSYIILPTLAALVQFFHYEASLVSIAISFSMVLIYVAAMEEQSEELEKISKSKAQTEERLEIATILNRCVKALSSSVNVDKAIYHLLEIINDYFDADRTYIFKLDTDQGILTNTYEYVKDQVTEQQENLQGIPVEVISSWMQKFEESNVYYILDLELEKGTPHYEILKMQDINRLLAVPLLRDEKIVGFMGVDNPRKHYRDETLLASLQFFVTDSLTRKREQEKLKYLSYRDMLTELFNRNKYIEVLERYKNRHVEKVGVAFIDLNGLKKVNDQKGHEAGDELIRNAAAVIKTSFPEKAFRIGGDEFVIIAVGMEEEEFFRKLKTVYAKMKEKEVSISAGFVWKEETMDLEALTKTADHQMYKEKEKYHRENRYEPG